MAVALGVSACGGSTSNASSNSSASASRSTAGGNGAGARQVPGTSGKIAEVDTGSIEVQSTTEQTTVKYGATTMISTASSATLADVAAGDCVVATGGVDRSTSASPTPTTALTATRVQIIGATTNGSCEAGFGRAGGFGGIGGPAATGTQPTTGTQPSGAPTNAPRVGSGGEGFGQRGGADQGAGTPPSRSATGRNFGGAVAGRVVSVSGTTIVVEETVRGRGASGSASPATSTTSRTVAVTAATTFTKTVAGSSASLVVGKCATAIGTTDSVGTVTARSITVSDPVNGSCTNGFAARRSANSGTASGASGGSDA